MPDAWQPIRCLKKISIFTDPKFKNYEKTPLSCTYYDVIYPSI